MSENKNGIVIGIDPGEPSGIAVLTFGLNAKFLCSNTVSLDEYTASFFLSRSLVQATKQLGLLDEQIDALDVFVAIEGQFLGRNPDSLIKLAHNAGRWFEATQVYKLRATYIAPAKWINSELGRKLRAVQIPKLMADKVAGTFKIYGRSEHENAAILIARFAAIEMFYKQRKKQKKQRYEGIRGVFQLG